MNETLCNLDDGIEEVSRASKRVRRVLPEEVIYALRHRRALVRRRRKFDTDQTNSKNGQKMFTEYCEVP